MEGKERKPRILGLGLACLDYVFLAGWAERGGQALIRDHVVCGGGLIGTAVVTAARLGAEAAIRCWVGDDDEGRQVVAGLEAEGVDVGGVVVVPGGRTPVSFVHVEEGTGERTIYHRPQPMGRMAAVSLAERTLACDVLVVDAIWPEASLIAARRARQQGIPVVGDFCPEGAAAELARCTSHLIISRACADRLAARASWADRLRHLAQFGSQFVAITAGPEGCHYLQGGLVAHQPAFPVAVVDTTGAGDVFHGAFAYALARGWPIPKCVELACAAAALSCRALGGRAGIPSLQEAVSLGASARPCGPTLGD